MNKYITEFLGTMFLVIAAILGAKMGAVTAGLTLMVMIYAGGHISGAHYNPAVSLAIWMRGRLETRHLVPYWISQIAGAAAGAAIVAYVFEKEGAGNCFIHEGGTAKAIVAELLGTFALAYVVLNVATSKGTHGNSFYGLAIGFTVLAMGTILGDFSGGVFNPAVYIGLCIQKSMCWDNWWVYLFSTIGGAIIAALIFSLNNPDDK